MRRVLFAVSGTVVGLVMLLSFKTHPTALSTPPAAASTLDPSDPAAADPSASATPGPSASGATAAGGTTTYTGTAADTRFGPVQVQITVTDGSVTAVQAVEYPQNDPRDQQINSYAIPVLDQEATSAKNSAIDMVSGATYTSQGYIQSLQSALDQAGL